MEKASATREANYLSHPTLLLYIGQLAVAPKRFVPVLQKGSDPGRLFGIVFKASPSSDQFFQDDYLDYMVKHVHYHCFTYDLSRFHPAFKQWTQYMRPPLASHVQPGAG